jgi:hypothetical protein
MIDTAPPALAPPHPGGPLTELAPGGREVTLFHSAGILVTSERLVAHGRTWLLGEIERVEAIHRAPRVLPLLVTLGGGVVLGLPGLLAAMAGAGEQGRGLYGVGLAVTGLAIFGAIAALVLVEDTYWLVLRTRQRERRVFRSRDRRLVSSLAAVVTEAAARQRP